MLWQKGWLETRFRMLFALGLIAFILCMQYWAGSRVAATPRTSAMIVNSLMLTNAIALIVICSMLAGAGITTQASVQAAKGIHGSSLYTLSLPVSRLRLMAVRVTIGWSECAIGIAILCCGIWLVSPFVRWMATPADVAEYAATLIACGSALYFFSVLLATFLDDQSRVWGTMLGACATWWFFQDVRLPASINIVQAIGRGSPLLVHTMPWPEITFALGLSAVLFLAALKVAQAREY